jgi:Fe-S cluster biogenesis protein NfuA
MDTFTINIQPTNNPTIIKFEANKFLVKHQSFEYKNIDEAKNSPLAQQLFYLPFVKTVFISSNFIGIERYNIVEWDDVQTEVAEQIENYLNSGQPIVLDDEPKKNMPITVYAESTPNPGVMKFVVNKKIVPQIFEFKNIEEAKHSALAQSIFHFPFVKEVFIDENYLSITKYDVIEWTEVTMELRDHIRNYLAEGKEVVSDGIFQSPQNETHAAKASVEIPEDETSQQIISILDEYIKPAVASDGGNIMFKSYDEKTKKVEVILQGACSGCPSSAFTLKNGIETMLKDMLSGKVEEVIAING